MRFVWLIPLTALVLGAGAFIRALRRASDPTLLTSEPVSGEWLAQARCVHLKEGRWPANTGNGYFGGFQFAAQTWKRVGGTPDDAFAYPGSRAHPFTATAQEQTYRAWLLWKHDGRSWKSWGAIGAFCSA